MIIDSLGLGELGIVLILIILLVEPKQVGRFLRETARLKRKLLGFQHDMRTRLDDLILEQERQESRGGRLSKAELRKEFRARARTLTAAERAEAAHRIVQRVAEWEVYRLAGAVTCFLGVAEEVDTEALARRILGDGKTLLVPYVKESVPAVAGAVARSGDAVEPAPQRTLGMARIGDFDRDLQEGAFRILEPRPELRDTAPDNPEPALHFVPGMAFDRSGGRLGKGLGFYDRYLHKTPGVRVGLCYDVQIADFNLPLEAHDQPMDFVLSEKRLVDSGPRGKRQ